jgi:choline-glycine betaine transporter
MASSPARERISAFALTAAMSGLVTSLGAGAVFASQGPGGGLGTASGFTQLAMAIIVYGTSALVVGTGLIGVARRRHWGPR